MIRSNLTIIYEKTFKMVQAELGENHVGTLTTMNNLATAYQSTGHLDKALPIFDSILEKSRILLIN